MAAEDFLKDWVFTYLKNRDIMTHSIKEIKKGRKSVDVSYKDGKKKTFKIVPVVESFSQYTEEGTDVCVVVLNNKHNLTQLIKEWQSIKNNATLSIFFVNPFSDIDKQWILYPSTHARICDDDALELGLTSMYDTVTPILLEEYERTSRNAAMQGKGT